MALIEFMTLNSSAAASVRQQRRCLAKGSSGANVPAMEKGARPVSRKAKVTAEHKAEAARLTALWNAKPDRGTQTIFGEKYKIGNQSAVGQFLRGESPLSLKAAKGFAKGLGCEIADFSPRLAAEAADLAALHHAQPARAEVLSFLDLNHMEAQLVGLFRGLTPDQQSDVMQRANKLHTKTHTGASAANPFAEAKKKAKH